MITSAIIITTKEQIENGSVLNLTKVTKEKIPSGKGKYVLIHQDICTSAPQNYERRDSFGYWKCSGVEICSTIAEVKTRCVEYRSLMAYKNTLKSPIHDDLRDYLRSIPFSFSV